MSPRAWRAAAAETCGSIWTGSERHLDQLLARAPQDFGSYYRRSILRRQLPEHNHVDAMARLLAKLPVGRRRDRPALLRAGEGVRGPGAVRWSIRVSRRGAARRRRGLSYQVSGGRP